MIRIKKKGEDNPVSKLKKEKAANEYKRKARKHYRALSKDYATKGGEKPTRKDVAIAVAREKRTPPKYKPGGATPAFGMYVKKK